MEAETERKQAALYQRLLDYEKLVGLCDSGGAGKALVASGAVRVDGAVETRKTAKIRAGQQVSLGDAEIAVLAGPEGGAA